MKELLKSLVGVVVFVASYVFGHVNGFARQVFDKVAAFWMVTGWAWSFALLFWDCGWAALSAASWVSLWACLLMHKYVNETKEDEGITDD